MPISRWVTRHGSPLKISASAAVQKRSQLYPVNKGKLTLATVKAVMKMGKIASGRIINCQRSRSIRAAAVNGPASRWAGPRSQGIAIHSANAKMVAVTLTIQ